MANNRQLAVLRGKKQSQSITTEDRKPKAEDRKKCKQSQSFDTSALLSAGFAQDRSA